MSGPPRVLLCYDGTDESRAAVEATAELFPGSAVVVVCFWHPLAAVARRFAISILDLVQDPSQIDERESELAEVTAEDGATLARSHGLDARPVTQGVNGQLDQTVVELAERSEASLVVIGARKGSAIGSMLTGDVARDIVNRSTIPVLVIPR